MNNQVIRYLRKYSADPTSIDRILVSTFIRTNNITTVKNQFIKQFIVTKNDCDYEALEYFLKIYKIKEIEDLIEAFEYVISPADKIVTGAIYTPRKIRECITAATLDSVSDLSKSKICDPACGCAGFLMTASIELKKKTNKSFANIFSQNIYGLDIQDYSVRRSKILLSLLAIVNQEDAFSFDFNLYQGNALEYDWKKEIPSFTGFDVIIGNPPYVSSRNIDNYSKSLLPNWQVCGSGHPDLYIPFFEIGLTWLNSNGILGYITMNTFYKSQNGRALRRFFLDKLLKFKIIDFGGTQVFRSKSTYTCICIIQNRRGHHLEYSRQYNISSINVTSSAFKKIQYSHLEESGWNLQNHELITQIEKTGIPLGKLFKTRNGIATLKNEVYVFTPYKEDKIYYYLSESDLKIEKTACKKIVNPNILTTQKDFRKIKQRIIFPYYYDERGNACVYPEDAFQFQFPETYKYLTSKKEILATRDKGKQNYETWFAYGRNQSLEKYPLKLLFPHITPATPNFVINSDPDLLFVNGISIVGTSKFELTILMKIMSSRVFWFYIVNSSKPYGSGYFSLSRNYIKTFGIVNLSLDEKKKLLSLKRQSAVNRFLEKKYNIDFNF